MGVHNDSLRGEKHRQVELQDGVEREKHEHARARNAADALVDLPPPTRRLVDVEEESEAVDAPVVVAHKLSLIVYRIVSQLLAKRDQDVRKEGGNSDRPAREVVHSGVIGGPQTTYHAHESIKTSCSPDMVKFYTWYNCKSFDIPHDDHDIRVELEEGVVIIQA